MPRPSLSNGFSRFRFKAPASMSKPLNSPPSSPPILEAHLEACKSDQNLYPALARLIVSGLIRQSFALCRLVELLSLSCDDHKSLLHARLLVDHHLDAAASSSTTFLCNTLIRGYACSRFPEEALSAFAKMLRNSLKPDNFTYPFVVKAASVRNSVLEGRQAHGQIVRSGFESDVFVLNTLLNMYSMFGDMGSARMLFDGSLTLDVVSWNTLIVGYVRSGAVETARRLFDEMPVRDELSWGTMISGYAGRGEMDAAMCLFDKMPVQRNTVTWNSMISGFARCGLLPLARKLFDDMPERNMISWNAMVAGYVRGGDLESARELFSKMPERDVISWSCMISAYAQSNRCRHALDLFNEMLIENRITPNEVTMMSVLSVCAQLATLEQGKWVHAYMDRSGMRPSDNLGAALIDMYAKCGSIETAIDLFWKLERRNVSSWNALITGLAINGLAHESLQVFAEMKSETKPNGITFLGVLTACSHGGLVDEGRRHFDSMSKVYGIQPEMKHYGCVVDLLGRAGLLVEAEQLVKSMPMKPDVMILGALLGACRIYGDDRLADQVRKDFLDLDPQQAGCHVLLSHIYAAADRWADACEIRNMISNKGIRKEPGSSSIELDGSVAEYTMGDHSHL